MPRTSSAMTGRAIMEAIEGVATSWATVLRTLMPGPPVRKSRAESDGVVARWFGKGGGETMA